MALNAAVGGDPVDHDEDEYQQRYRDHQARKSETLARILAERHSDRMFAPDPVDKETVRALCTACSLAPSSCDRQAVSPTIVTERDQKALLGGILVGGVGWVHRAPLVLLFFAAEAAYKAPGEKEFMPYLDAGIAIGQVWLTAAAHDLAAAYINPNIRDMNRDHFARVFGTDIFCGALAIGHRHPDSPDHARAISGRIEGVVA